jgi:Sugar (pentulose and hexulose) kinases
VALQITADIFNRPVEKPKISEASALGSAMLAFYGLGIYKSIDEAVKNMYKVGKIIHPNTNNISLYEKIYQNAYLKIYQNLKPIYKELKNIL